MTRQVSTRYGAITQSLHWLTAAVVVIAFTYGLGEPESRVYLPSRDFDRQIHETLGVLVLALVALRLLWRPFDPRPMPDPEPTWMRLAARIMQIVLYALMFAVPLTAIAGAWLEGHALMLVGGLQFPSQLLERHSTGETLAAAHTLLADGLIWLAGLHALAGLYHHFVLKDRVYRSMLPRRWTAGIM